jgi:hypothetical protein
VAVNRDVYLALQARYSSMPVCYLTPLFARSATMNDAKNSNGILGDAGKHVGLRALVYANSRDFRNGIETYGLLFVGRLLPKLREIGFHVVFLDVRNEYTLNDLDPFHSGNITHITESVDFLSLCSEVQLYVRPTATDGNSVALIEAQTFGIPVVASDVAPRPPGVYLYPLNDDEAFLSVMSAVRDAIRSGLIPKEFPGETLSPLSDYENFLTATRPGTP